MNELTKVFIEENIEQIENNEFTALYKNASGDHVDIQDLTNSLYEADIDPLEYMTEIPKKFFYRSAKSIDGFKIPNNIQTIIDHAFYQTDIMEINIPEGVTSIESKSFGMCPNLLFVSIPHSMEFIDRAVFLGSNALAEVRYNGTLEEWDAIDKYDKWISLSRVIRVHLICKDGDRWVN